MNIVVPDFKIGDKIEFELSRRNPNNEPRWQTNIDTTGCNKWAFGVVNHIDFKIIQTEYEVEGCVGKGVCHWPNWDHKDYDINQWSWEGYLRRDTSKKEEEISCECGAENVYGANIGSFAHSYWCKKYNKGEEE